MRLVSFRDPRGNFGDDLNDHIWNELLSARVRDSDFTLIGIGSLINAQTFQSIPSSARAVILGTGASYGPPPVIQPHWDVLAVRGPLTARLIGQEQAAVTDGAILLADTPRLVPAALVKDRVLFMPHNMSASPAWREAAAAAGLDYVDPCAPVPLTLAQFSRARLVVTEAMHGAIVADTLRIPWVPVRISPRFDRFKWLDWTLSMGVPLAPVDLPAISLRLWAQARRQRQRFEKAGSGESRPVQPDDSRDALIDHLVRRHAGQPYSQPVRQASSRIPLMEAAKRWADHLDPFLMKIAVRHLRRAAGVSGVLSEDRLFEARLDRMREALSRLEISCSSAWQEQGQAQGQDQGQD